MNTPLIAINADAARIDGNMETLRGELEYFKKLGFGAVELSPHGLDCIYNGHLIQSRLKEVLRILNDFSFKYTVHSPNPMNLMNLSDLNVEKRMFRASLEFTAAVGAGMMVYHAGRYLPEEYFGMQNRKLTDTYEKEKMWHTELTLLREMGDLAEDLGIDIGVENARPYLDIGPYCYGELPDSLVEMIQSGINHHRIGITLDLGHLYLASEIYKFDPVQAVKKMKPYIKHIHLHDNFGKPCASYEKRQYELTSNGRGDLHMPIGWGKVPAAECLGLLDDYQGAVTLEMRGRYRAHFGDALTTASILVK